MKRIACLALTACVLAAQPASAQYVAQPTGSPEQRQAIGSLDFLDGEWRGTAVITGPGGQTETLTQTERVGSLLGGSIKVIEGRGYAADGSTQFNAMAVISWNAAGARYGFRSYAQGFTGDFKFERTDDGFRWETSAGPGATMRYVAVVKDGTWHEVGDYVAEGHPPVRTIEMRLTRIGDTTWPAGSPVSPVP